ELDAEEQVAVETANRQLAVHVGPGLPDDEAAQPVLEPGRLRHDDRHHRRTGNERADNRNDLKRPPDYRHPSPAPCLLTAVTSERLTDAEVHAPVPPLGLTVDAQVFDRVQLIAEVEAQRTDWREIPQARTGGVAQITEVDIPRARPDI